MVLAKVKKKIKTEITLSCEFLCWKAVSSLCPSSKMGYHVELHPVEYCRWYFFYNLQIIFF